MNLHTSRLRSSIVSMRHLYMPFYLYYISKIGLPLELLVALIPGFGLLNIENNFSGLSIFSPESAGVSEIKHSFYSNCMYFYN